jgi:hypothetical protein
MGRTGSSHMGCGADKSKEKSKDRRGSDSASVSDLRALPSQAHVLGAIRLQRCKLN